MKQGKKGKIKEKYRKTWENSSLNFIRLLRVVITPSVDEKTTRSNRMNFRLGKTGENVEKHGKTGENVEKHGIRGKRRKTWENRGKRRKTRENRENQRKTEKHGKPGKIK